jgi:hypothetical protein
LKRGHVGKLAAEPGAQAYTKTIITLMAVM